MNKYQEWNDKLVNKFNDLPIKFAFDDKQFKEMLKEMGLSEGGYKNKILHVGGGGYIKKTDDHLLQAYSTNRKEEYKELKKNENFMYEAFYWELDNNKYCITYEEAETLKALDLTHEEIKNNKLLSTAFEKALTQYLKDNEITIKMDI